MADCRPASRGRRGIAGPGDQVKRSELSRAEVVRVWVKPPMLFEPRDSLAFETFALIAKRPSRNEGS